MDESTRTPFMYTVQLIRDARAKLSKALCPRIHTVLTRILREAREIADTLWNEGEDKPLRRLKLRQRLNMMEI